MANHGKHYERKERWVPQRRVTGFPFTSESGEASLRKGQSRRDMKEKQELAKQRKGQKHSQQRKGSCKGPGAGESLVLWRLQKKPVWVENREGGRGNWELKLEKLPGLGSCCPSQAYNWP